MTSFRLPFFVNLSFQLTSSQGGWPEVPYPVYGHQYFNSHPHKEDDGDWMDRFIREEVFQLTSSQGGWQGGRRIIRWINISTHILTRRMTDCGRFYRSWKAISTHILTRRMTWLHFHNCLQLQHFNSHPHKEDDDRRWVEQCVHIISTHILTRRMTYLQCVQKSTGIYFNSHPHKEDDIGAVSAVASSCTFQLTSSQGGWRDRPMSPPVCFIFQLTSSQGGWHKSSRSGYWSSNFNSHPHKEDDTPGEKGDDVKNISTHILTRRMTRPFEWWQKFSIFQLTSSQGGWRISRDNRPALLVFQLTSSQGGWRRKQLSNTYKSNISTHILTRRMTGKEMDDLGEEVFQLTSSQGGWRRTGSTDEDIRGISTHILTRRMTIWPARKEKGQTFQLTSSQGGWQQF